MIQSVSTNNQQTPLTLEQMINARMPKPTPLPFMPAMDLSMFDAPMAQSDTMAAAARDKISLTPQSLATIITNAVVKAVTAVVNIFIEKLSSLLGAQQAPAQTAGGSVGTSPEPTQGSTPATSSDPTGTAGNSGTNGSDTPNTIDTKEVSIGDVLTQLKDILLNKDHGILTTIKDIFTDIFPAKSLKSLGKLFRGVTSSLKKLFPKASSLFKGALSAGKKLLGKIF